MRLKLTCKSCKRNIEIEGELIAEGAIACPNCTATLEIPSNILDVDQVLGGFRIQKHLGSGNMGCVYLATQISMDRKVALKVLPPEMTKNQEDLDNFMNEVRMLARLDHVHIVAAYEAGVEDGNYFMAMTYVDGETLEDYLEREKKMDEYDALQICKKIASALQYAWEKHQILHRDIKPANIIVDKAMEPKLLDMGISKVHSEDEEPEQGGGFLVGTPHYMSPEQAKAGGNAGFQSDMYALGCTIYHMVTGEVPYDGETVLDVLTKHALDPFPRPKQLVEGLSESCLELLHKMMAKKPSERHESWDDLIEDVERVIKGDLPKGVKPKSSSGEHKHRRSFNAAKADAVRQHVHAKPPMPAWKKAAIISASIFIAAVLIGVCFMAYSGFTADSRQEKQEREAEAKRLADKRKREMEARKREADRKLAALKHGSKNGGSGKPDVKDDTLKNLFVAAQDFTKDNPESYIEAMRRYQAVVDAASGASPYYSKSQNELKRLKDLLDVELNQVMEKLEEAASPFLKRSDFARAIGTFSGYAGPYAVETSDQRKARIAELETLRANFEKSAKQSEKTLQVLTDRVARSLVRMEFSSAKKQVQEAGRDSAALAATSKFRHLQEVTTICSRLSYIVAEAFEAKKGKTFTVDLKDGPLELEVVSVDGVTIRGMKLIIIGESKGRVKREFTASDLSYSELYKRISEGRSSDPGYAVLLGILARRIGKLSRCKQHFNEAELFLAEALEFFTNARGDAYQQQSAKILSAILKRAKIPQGTPASMLAAVRAMKVDAATLKGLKEDVSQYNRRYGDSKIAVKYKGFLKALEHQLDALGRPPMTQVQITAMIAALRRTVSGGNIAYSTTPVGGSIALVLKGNRTLSNVGALSGRPIVSLDLSSTRVSNLAPISELPLYELRLSNTRISSLYAIRNLGLSTLDLSKTQIRDLKHLVEMPLAKLSLSETSIRDLSPLAKLPLIGLDLSGCTEIESLDPLLEIKTLRTLVLPANDRLYRTARALSALTRIGTTRENLNNPGAFWRGYDVARANKFEADWAARMRTALGTLRQANGIAIDDFWPRVRYVYDGIELRLSNMRAIANISALAGLPISEFEAHRTAIKDLTPLRNAPLRELTISETSIASLQPVLKCPIEFLNLSNTDIKSHSEIARIPTLRRLVLDGDHIKKLDFLRKTKLRELTVEDARIKDLSYLRDVPLRKLTMRRCSLLSSLRPLRDVKTLEELNFTGSKVKDLTVIRDLPIKRIDLSYTQVTSYSTLRKFELKGLNVSGTPLRNLSGLEHLQLDTLIMDDTPMRRLNGIEKMPLVDLRIGKTRITDLDLIRDKKLSTLHIHETGVKDISLLGKLPLRELRMDGCKHISDIAVLKGHPTLQRLTFPEQVRDFQFLRQLPELRNVDTKWEGWWRTTRDRFFGID